MPVFLLLVAILALIISKIALFVYLLISFSLEIKGQVEPEGILHFAKRIKRILHDQTQIILGIKKTILRINTLLWTFSIGEFVGYIFLFLTSMKAKFFVLGFNAVYLYIGSLMCQLLTILNMLFKRKMDSVTRLFFQINLVILATILITMSASRSTLAIDRILSIIVIFYFTTVIIALYSMLLDAIAAKQFVYTFDFNHYSRLVILLGLMIGSFLCFNFNLSF
jgi:hypothetical protein